MTAREAWRVTVEDAARGFRLDCAALRRDWWPEQELVRAGVAEILRLRLEAAYAPVFATLNAIERKVAVLARPYDVREHYGRRR